MMNVKTVGIFPEVLSCWWWKISTAITSSTFQVSVSMPTLINIFGKYCAFLYTYIPYKLEYKAL
jgi:hypothetical protein